MTSELITEVTYEEIEAYQSLDDAIAKSLAFARYYTQYDYSYTLYMVLNYLVNRYNQAIRESETSIDLTDARFTDLSYKRLCEVGIPFLKEMKGVNLHVSRDVPTVWNITSLNPESQNTMEWPRLPLASFVRKRVLRIKE